MRFLLVRVAFASVLVLGGLEKVGISDATVGASCGLMSIKDIRFPSFRKTKRGDKLMDRKTDD